jgi:hypothetical protein
LEIVDHEQRRTLRGQSQPGKSLEQALPPPGLSHRTGWLEIRSGNDKVWRQAGDFRKPFWRKTCETRAQGI